MEFSENILLYFQEHDIKPAQISAKIGVNKSTFTKWKNKPTSKIDLDIAFKISRYLNVSIERLITGQECNSKVITDDDGLLEKFYRLKEKDQGKILERIDATLELYTDEHDPAYKKPDEEKEIAS